MSKRATPLTDAMIRQIEQRLTWRGAKVSAAKYAGISRQNLGKFFRECGVGRDSEILLRLEEFSRWPISEQRRYAGACPFDSFTSDDPSQQDTSSTPAPLGTAAPDTLPTWLL